MSLNETCFAIMSYKIFYTPRAVKDIRRLDPVVKKKVGKKIETLLVNPLSRAHKLTDSKAGDYRWRIGNYRVVFDVSGKTIYVLRVRHRKDIYKK